MVSLLSSLRAFHAKRTAAMTMSMKLGIAFAAALLLGVLGLGVFSNQRARRQAIQSEPATLGLLSERLAGQVDTHLSTTRSLAQNLAHTRDAERFLAASPSAWPVAAFNDWLDLQAGMTPGAAAIFVMDPEGTCLASSNRAFIGKNFSFRTYFQEARAGRTNTSDWFLGAVTGTPRISSAAPIRTPEGIAGVLVVEYLVEGIETAIRGFGREGRTAVLMNRQGILLAHSHPGYAYHALEQLQAATLEELARNRQFLGRSIPVDPLSADLVTVFHRVLEEGTPHTVRYRLGETWKWGTLNPVKGQAWVVMVSVPEAEILFPTRALWRETILVGILSAGGAFLLALLLVRVLLRPLEALSASMATFGQGDITARAPQQPHRELDQVARTFNTMADTIQRHQGDLEALVHRRTQDLEQALADMKRLHGMIPICSYCKQIRDDSGSWWQLESYIQSHSEAEFSHGICPDCRQRHFPGVHSEPEAGPTGS
jgi:C4-dicarboxylate-specific signal transduction histidine kinase